MFSQEPATFEETVIIIIFFMPQNDKKKKKKLFRYVSNNQLCINYT